MAHPVIDALPGFAVKVSAALHSLDKAWADEGDEAARASQMNLVLMFGASVTPAEGGALTTTPIVALEVEQASAAGLSAGPDLGRSRPPSGPR